MVRNVAPGFMLVLSIYFIWVWLLVFFGFYERMGAIHLTGVFFILFKFCLTMLLLLMTLACIKDVLYINIIESLILSLSWMKPFHLRVTSDELAGFIFKT